MNVDLVCFGELLWDILPNHKVAGGAPFNIANRASALGLNASVISSVGNDQLGKELVAAVASMGNSTDFIQYHSSLPTSTVQVELSETGEPRYDIVYPVAWDDILINDRIIGLVEESNCIAYSSLGIRDERSREVLFKLLEFSRLKICDINLREGQYKRETIERMLDAADILKMNESELDIIAQWEGLVGLEIKDTVGKLCDRYNYDAVIVTLGNNGALSYTNNKFYHQPVFKVAVKDTVGSGDAFLAAYISKRLKNYEESECLMFACAVGAVNASKNGGTAQIRDQEIAELMRQA